MDLKQFTVLPKMIVFDLDYTLWPLWIEMYSPPFIINSHKLEPEVRDKSGRIVNPFPEVTDILKTLATSGMVLGIASRTPEPKAARRLVETMGWDRMIPYMEIYPGCKVSHFENLVKHSKIPLSEMLFFDDEIRNIRDLTAHGVVCFHVGDSGVNRDVVMKGLKKFQQERSK